MAMRRPWMWDEQGKFLPRLFYVPTWTESTTIVLTFNAEAGRVVGYGFMLISGYLDFKKMRSIAKIKSFLSNNVEFKIGKIDDLERRESQYKSEGYTNFYVITKCTTLEEVDKQETDLITFFRNYSICKNENDGGGGKTSENEVFYIFLVTK